MTFSTWFAIFSPNFCQVLIKYCIHDSNLAFEIMWCNIVTLKRWIFFYALDMQKINLGANMNYWSMANFSKFRKDVKLEMLVIFWYGAIENWIYED